MGRVPRGKRRRKGETKPEDASTPIYLDAKESARYAQNCATKAIQEELTLECVQLLARHAPAPASAPQESSVLLNVGCGGNGYCSSVIARHGMRWVGADVSRPMLREAPSSLAGLLVQADCFGRLPFADASFDHAISVSAIQWLCCKNGAGSTEDGTPASSPRLFFRELARVTKESAVFIAQLYPRNQEDVELLQDSAREAGWCGTVHTAFPHATKAKKKFLCLQKHGIETSYHACPLSWPFRTPCGGSDRARLRQEHAEFSNDSLRLLRRACVGTAARMQTQTQSSTQSPTQEQAKYDVVSVTCSALVPCGGSLAVHVWGAEGRRGGNADTYLRSLFGDGIGIGIGIGITSTEVVDTNKPGTPADWGSWATRSGSGDAQTTPFPHFSLRRVPHARRRTLAVLEAPKRAPLVVLVVDMNAGDTLPININASDSTHRKTSIVGIDIRPPFAAILLYLPNCLGDLGDLNL